MKFSSVPVWRGTGALVAAGLFSVSILAAPEVGAAPVVYQFNGHLTSVDADFGAQLGVNLGMNWSASYISDGPLAFPGSGGQQLSFNGPFTVSVGPVTWSQPAPGPSANFLNNFGNIGDSLNFGSSFAKDTLNPNLQYTKNVACGLNGAFICPRKFRVSSGNVVLQSANDAINSLTPGQSVDLSGFEKKNELRIRYINNSNIFQSSFPVLGVVDHFSVFSTQSIIQNFQTLGELPQTDIPLLFELPDNVPTTPGEAYSFASTPVIAGQAIVFDPEVATGYEFEIGNPEDGIFFETLLVPGLGGDSEFDLIVFDELGDEFHFDLLANELFDFTTMLNFDVTRFLIEGIDVALGLNPLNTSAFPAVISFTGSGNVDLTQTPMLTTTGGGGTPTASVPEPGTLALFGLGLAGFVFARRRHSV